MTITERKEKLRRFGLAYREIWDTVMQLPREMWSYKASARRWSVQEIIVHIVDSEANGYIRYRKAIAESGKPIAVYDQEAWARNLKYDDQNAEKLLELFKWLRTVSYELLTSLPESAWTQTVIHPERGEITLDDLLTINTEHLAKHIAQIQRLFAVWQEHTVH